MILKKAMISGATFIRISRQMELWSRLTIWVNSELKDYRVELDETYLAIDVTGSRQWLKSVSRAVAFKPMGCGFDPGRVGNGSGGR